MTRRHLINEPSLNTTTKDVGLGGISVAPNRHRALRDDAVKKFMASMKVSGLINSISLRPKPNGSLG